MTKTVIRVFRILALELHIIKNNGKYLNFFTHLSDNSPHII